jgi:hypothetical protein
MRYLIILCYFLHLGYAKAQSISVSGSWNPMVSASVITEAGQDYPAGYSIESASNQSSINLTLGGGIFNVWFNNWRVDIQRADVLWPAGMTIETRRTTNGTGSIFSSISGGTAYQLINPGANSFFQGTGSFNNINVQYRISGMSIVTPVNTYSTTILFTLIDN